MTTAVETSNAGVQGQSAQAWALQEPSNQGAGVRPADWCACSNEGSDTFALSERAREREREREPERERERERGRERERERERGREGESRSHFGSSTAPLLGGLCRLLASGGRCEVDPKLSTLGEPSHLSQRCLSKHTRCRFASGP